MNTVIIRNFYDYDPSASLYENGGGPIITVPDQSLSVKQILERFRRGTLDPSALVSTQFVDDPDDDLDVFVESIEDISDLHRMIDMASDKIVRLRDRQAREYQEPKSTENEDLSGNET